MGLLSHEERRDLTRAERKALREIRREARQLERATESKRPWPGVHIDVAALTAVAETEMQELAEDLIPGKDKMKEVLAVLAERADDFLIWDWAGPGGIVLEAVDGPILKALIKLAIWPLVDQVYRGLERRGLV